MFSEFKNSKGAKFVGINTYESTSSGEIADYVVNINVNYNDVLKRDLIYLKSLNDNDLIRISKGNINLDTMKIGLSELIASLEKRINGEKNNHSLGQENAYETICNGVRLHLESEKIHIFGFRISKNIKVAGTYKTVNSSQKTLAKNAIKKGMKSEKFRTFIIDNADQISINKRKFDI